MNRILLVIGGLLVGLMALLFAAPAMVDWNRYRGIFEEEASRFLGREVRVGGKVNLRLLPVPYVRFEKVRVADTTANVGRPLFQADDFTVWLSIGALLGGGFEASEIELRKPVLTLVLDGKGGGNWSSLAQGTRTPGQTPLRIAFNAVRITNGTVAILGPRGETRNQFDYINGELSAQALEGPYKIAAAFAFGGAPREIRLSTAKPAEDGGVRFRGTVRDPASGVSYSLDGQARDVLDKLKVTGEMTARLPLPAALAGRPEGKAAAGEFDVKAELKGDTSGFTLSDLALSFEQAGRPQLAAGSARVNWSDRTDVALTLRSQWLDLDRIAGGEKGGAPLQLVNALAEGVARVLATDGRTEATLVIDQATLGGDVASDLSATLEHTNGKLQVRNFAASLPGGARLTATGAFDRRQNEQHYDGQVNLRGASLTRFLGWAARGQTTPLPASDAPFSFVGGVTLGTAEIAGRNLTVQIGRNTLTGEASWKAGKPPLIAVNLDGSEFDLTPLLDAGVEPARALRTLIARLSVGQGVRTTGTVAGTSPPDAEIRLRVDRLVAGKTVFRDAVTELRLTSGDLSVQQLRLASDDGYAIEIRGDIAGLAQPAAKGTLTGLATAAGPQGVDALARLLGVPADLVPGQDGAAQLSPLRLAGRLQVGVKGPDTHDLAIDGTVAHSRVAGTLRLGAETASWRDRPIDLAVDLEGRDLPRLLARLASGAPSSASASQPPAARLGLRGIGTTRAGLVALGSIESDGTAAEYRGRISLDDAALVGLDGELTLALADLGRSLSLVGLPSRPALAGAASGTLRLTRNAGRLQLATTRLALAGSELSGTLTVEPSTGETRTVAGEIKLDSASVPALLAALTTGSGTARAGRSDSGSPWNEQPLDLPQIDRLAGSRIRVEVGRLVLAPGMDVAEARVDVTARVGGLDLRLTEGKSMGGRAEGLIALEKAPAGVKLSAEGRLAGARLETLTGRGGHAPAATGGLSLSLKAAGTALTPRGLIVALAGSGEVLVEQARLNRWTPAAIASAAETVLATRGEVAPGLLREQLEAALRSGGIALGSRKLALTIADGAMQTAPLVATAPRGRMTGRAALDLDSLRIDGEWRLEPLNTPQPPDTPPKPELPAVTIVYAGPLAAMASLEPRLDFEALEREVAVRKVEREVVELERLRKLDEERARVEAERIETERRLIEQRRLEAQQQSAPGAPGTLSPLPAATPTLPLIQPPTATSPSATAPQTTGELAPPPPLAAQQPVDTPAQALPPATVERTPLSRPAQASAPAKSKGVGDPFKGLREFSP